MVRVGINFGTLTNRPLPPKGTPIKKRGTGLVVRKVVLLGTQPQKVQVTGAFAVPLRVLSRNKYNVRYLIIN